MSTTSVVRSEWIKFRSVRSNRLALLGAASALVVLGMLFASVGDAEQGPRGTVTDSLAISLGGITLSQLVVAVLGTVFVTSEYATGLIRTMFGAVGRRSRVLGAKIGVVGVSVGATMTVASFVAFFAGQAVLADGLTAMTVDDPGVARALLGAGLYLAAVAVIGVALGFIVRSTAAAIGILVGMLMIAPVLIGLLPGELGDQLAKVLPSRAGDALMSVSSPDTLLSPGLGLLTLALWAAGWVAAAWFAVERRDA